jgi:hypothetical protein
MTRGWAPMGYELVWADDFDGDRLDTGIWGPWTNDAFIGRDWCEPVEDLHDERCFRVADSILTIEAPAPAQGSRALVPAAICTRESMWFRRGWAEIRARFDATRDGAWGAWWTNTRHPDVNYANSGYYTAENDVYESNIWQDNWQALNNQQSTLHKWHNDGGPAEAAGYRASSRFEDAAWHVLSLDWTADRMQVLRDGVRCGYADLATGFGRRGMRGFQDPAYMLLDMWPRGQGLTNAVRLDIDWIRVWQDPADDTQQHWIDTERSRNMNTQSIGGGGHSLPALKTAANRPTDWTVAA